MSVLDTYVLNDVIYRTLENGNADAAGTLLTSMFTLQEIVDSMNRVQQEFLLDAGIHVAHVTIPGIAGTNIYDLPTDSIRPRRVSWTDPADPSNPFSVTSTRSLTLDDTWEQDHGMSDWTTSRDLPFAWYETTLPQQKLGIAKTPINNGTIGLLYVQLAAALTGSGVALTVPDDWTPYILWGTLAELLSSDGPAFDPVRAQYCRRRYDEGVELAKLVLKGS